ncbi:MAG: sensor histidine kinase N-terminal domain-containing protein [Nannocystis sp.]|uniref:sensor histidine kinase n=1 Tax=Nannocystis sp. TaxID=1962667 RepID=UPI00242324EA|nr:ATP-binding protein [Nannocystis sp.]MBK9756375.1 sensor histidine kinase N-terminal domain-containing protein [Nannocystis sp.]
MSGSLRGRLLAVLLAVVAPVVAGLCVLLYLAVARAVWAAFDDDLHDLAGTLAASVELDHEGYDLELLARDSGAAMGPGRRSYLQLWGPDGALLHRSAGLGEASLPRSELGGFRVFVGEAELRGVVLRFAPAFDPEDGVVGTEQLTIAVAREVAGTRALLGTIAGWFVGLGVVILAAAALAVRLGVGRGLRPLERIAASIAAIDERALARRVAEDDLPSELRPIVLRLNALLGRLEAAFARERQFTADAAHELRTPLTILHAALELALLRERSPDEYRGTIRLALETVEQTSGLVERLLALARVDAEAGGRREAVGLHGLVEGVWTAQAGAASARGLTLDNRIEPARMVEADPDSLRLVVGNLLANAVAYTEQGGWIAVESDAVAGVVVAVIDSGPQLADEQLAAVFDRFWRGDLARGDDGHFGIGLALVRSLCAALGWTVTAENRGDGSLAFVVRGTGGAARVLS